MKSAHLPIGIATAVLCIAGCQAERSTGTTTETENAVAARTIPVDSILSSDERPLAGPAIATLRFNANNFDFAKSMDSGRDLSVNRLDGSIVPFEIVHWDRAAYQGRIHVRIDGPLLLLPNSKFEFRWNLPKAHREDSDAVWAGLDDNQRLFANSVLVDDFEKGNLLKNRLPDSSFWYIGGSLPPSGIFAAGQGRQGSAVRVSCFTGQCDTGRVVLAATLLAKTPRSLRAMDSLVFWTRGTGRIWIAMEHMDSARIVRAWTSRSLDSAWKRILIRPSDFDVPDGHPDNIGWTALRDSINYVTFLIEGGKEMWIDDVRLHGITPGDLK